VESKPDTAGCVISIYVEASQWTRAKQQTLRKCLPAGVKSPRVQTVRREDWAESWKRHFKPIEIGRELLVKPSWSKRRARKGQAVVVLDPGLSFGTGQHHTTRFCLTQLVKLRRKGEKQSVFDIGTGSGILAIAAARLGYAPLSAIDNDAEAVRIARDNARRNRVERKIHFQCNALGDMRRLSGFDVVCANLIANVLMAESERIVGTLKPCGALIASGILDREFSDVAAEFERRGLQLIRTQKEKPWRSGVFRKP